MLYYNDLNRDVVKRMKWNNLFQNPQNLTAIFPPRIMGTRDGEGSDCKKGQKREGEERGKKSQIFNIGRWSGGG